MCLSIVLIFCNESFNNFGGLLHLFLAPKLSHTGYVGCGWLVRGRCNDQMGEGEVELRL